MSKIRDCPENDLSEALEALQQAIHALRCANAYIEGTIYAQAQSRTQYEKSATGAASFDEIYKIMLEDNLIYQDTLKAISALEVEYNRLK